jgi:hypothetical protein
MKRKLLFIHHSAFLLHPFFFILSILSILFESTLMSLAFGLIKDSKKCR